MTLVVATAEDLDEAIRLAAITMMRRSGDGRVVGRLSEIEESAQRHLESLGLPPIELPPFSGGWRRVAMSESMARSCRKQATKRVFERSVMHSMLVTCWRGPGHWCLVSRLAPRNAGPAGGEILRLRSMDDLRSFVQDHTSVPVTELQELLERLERHQPWDQLSLPLRAKFLGLVLGDGSSHSSGWVRVGLQVIYTAFSAS